MKSQNVVPAKRTSKEAYVSNEIPLEQQKRIKTPSSPIVESSEYDSEEERLRE